MTAVRITKTVVEQTKPTDKDVLVHDSELKGFHLKVTPHGKRVFFVYYRTKGARVQQRRYKIGDYPKISVSRARELAQRAFWARLQVAMIRRRSERLTETSSTPDGWTRSLSDF